MALRVQNSQLPQAALAECARLPGYFVFQTRPNFIPLEMPVNPFHFVCTSFGECFSFQKV
jgi:hypothetical protein